MTAPEAFLTALTALAASRGFTLPNNKASYGADRSIHRSVTPAAVASPNTVDDVAAVVQLCRSHNVPLTVRGAGTGLEGGCIPRHGGLVLDTSKLRRFDVDQANQQVWVGAGFSKLELIKKLLPFGLHFGPDPASNPSVGGMCSTAGSGMSTLKYGTTRENVVSLRVVTAAGEIIQTRPCVRKSSSSLDLTQLYCGSEGTLGVICEICFKTHPLLPWISGGYATFEKTESAAAAVVQLRQHATPLPSLVRCELLNREAVAVANKAYRTVLPEGACAVLFEFADVDEQRQQSQTDFTLLQTIFSRHHVTKMVRLTDQKALEGVWEARRGCLMAAGTFRGRSKMEKLLNTDVCVPLSRLAEVIHETEKDFAAHHVPCIVCAHIADGNFHCFIPFSNEEEKKVVIGLEARMVQRAIAAGGTSTGEHGVGVGKVKHLVREHGEAHVAVQRSIKKALDPLNLMNPGSFYPPESKL